MHRTDAPNNVGNLHTEGDPQMGQPATTVSADIMNALQEELAGFIESTGLTLNKADNTQLEAAINSIIGAGPGQKNLLINGSFRSWRIDSAVGTDIEHPGGYLADRWISSKGDGTTGATIGFETQGIDEAGLPNQGSSPVRRFLRHNMTVATLGPNPQRLRQKIEDVRSVSGQTLTLSFYAKLDTGDPTVDVVAKLIQHYGTGGSPSADVETTAATIVVSGDSWTRYQVTVTNPSVAGKTLGTDAGTSYLELSLEFEDVVARVDMWGVQLEVGGAASTFQLRTFGEHRLLCERYFWTTYDMPQSPLPPTSPPANNLSTYDDRDADSGRLRSFQRRFRVPMRVPPTVTWYTTSTSETTQTNEISIGALNIVVDATHETNEELLGYPEVQGTGAGVFEAHVICDAEFPTT